MPAPRAFTCVITAIFLAFGCQKPPWQNAEDGDDSPAPRSEKDPRRDIPRGVSFSDMPVENVPLGNLDSMIQRLGLPDHHSDGHHGQDLKIAVLDNGFTGFHHSRGERLPPATRLIKGNGQLANTTHGLKLAEIVHAVATGEARYEGGHPHPEIILVNANGYTNLKNAIDTVIAEDVDIVLYAQVWEYGGNMDGEGFINKEVDRAVDAGILWVNAAGNNGLSSYEGPITLDNDWNVRLPHQGRYVRMTVPQDGTPVKLVASWNDFRETTSYSTTQDLDLVLENEFHEIVGEARKVQDGKPPQGEGRHSAHAREIVRARLDAGTYYVRLEARSDNFSRDSQVRLTAQGSGVRFTDRTEDDTVLIPAGNPRVLSVGARDVNYTARRIVADESVKPELWVTSKTRFEGGRTYYGTSAASAIATGALAVFASAYGKEPLEEKETLEELILNGTLARPDGEPLCAKSAPNRCTAKPVLELNDTL